MYDLIATSILSVTLIAAIMWYVDTMPFLLVLIFFNAIFSHPSYELTADTLNAVVNMQAPNVDTPLVELAIAMPQSL